jgi:hypothetical protein
MTVKWYDYIEILATLAVVYAIVRGESRLVHVREGQDHPI